MVIIKRSLVVVLVLFALCLCGVKVQAASPDDNKKQQDTDIKYIKGRPLTEEEIQEQKRHEPKELKELGIDKNELRMSKRYNKSLDKRLDMTGYESKYDSRSKNIVTKVKDQGVTQWCWSFSLSSCMETSMIKNGVSVGGKKSTVSNTDLSEGALVYYFYNRTCTNDPLNGSANDKNTYKNSTYCLADYSGNTLLAGQFLTTWMGAKPESYYSVNTNEYKVLKSPDIKKAYTNNSAVVKNLYYIYPSKDYIKKAVKDYGSATVSFYWDWYYFNYQTAAFSCPSNASTNHAVTVVGWDDNYSYKNFGSSSKVTKNGAWIVKNSWSNGWGDKGYFYLSYQDASLVPMCAVDMQAANAYDHNYFYDGTSGLDSESVENGGMMANEFIAHGNNNGGEVLKAVSIGLDDSYINYSIQVYTKLKNPADPKSGTKALSSPVTGTTTYPGVYTIPLKKDIALSKGERFSIVVTFKSQNYNNTYVQCERTYDGGWIKFNASFQKNQSYYGNARTGEWLDLSVINTCARIKAYTDNPKPKKYKVQFKNGSKVISTQYIEKGKSASAPKVSRTGYSFVKWSGSYTNVQRDLVISAVWKANTYTINFNSNCGKNSMKTMYCTYDKETILRTNKFTRSGFTFVGWASDKKGKSPWYKSKAKIKNLTSKQGGNVILYAQWSKNIKISSIKSSKSKSLTVSYQKTDAFQTGYKIVYSTDKNFKGAKTITVKGYKNTSKTITNLSSRKRYYVKVRPYRTIGKTNYNGSYFGDRSVVVK